MLSGACTMHAAQMRQIHTELVTRRIEDDRTQHARVSDTGRIPARTPVAACSCSSRYAPYRDHAGSICPWL
jgi:hypothetical protein